MPTAPLQSFAAVSYTHLGVYKRQAQYALRQKDRILAPIQRELALARTLTDSPLLQRWVRDENNPDLKAAALAELESYRRHFADRSYFVAIDSSKHFYFNDAADAYRGRELGHTPVSYTHLDVYKRQIVRRFRLLPCLWRLKARICLLYTSRCV